MKTRIVERTSVFPAGRQEVFTRLQKFETLQKVAWPYATFTPVSEEAAGQWQEGETVSFRFRLFGLIPYGVHTIHVIRFNEERGIYTREGNKHVPVWNHRILLKETASGTCEYTDRVEIGAGWKTGIVYSWAVLFYRHRQKKWIRILRKSKRTAG